MMKSTLDLAKDSPYYKRNHVGKVTCTLCNIYCNDENNFIKHISGKTHMLSLERIEQAERRQRRLQEEEKRNLEAYERAQQEEKARELVLQQVNQSSATKQSGTSSLSSLTPLTGIHGLPQYAFKTEHDPVQFSTKIWLDFFFPHAEEGTRPAHRWLSAREQRMENNANEDKDYFVYLLVACEGYTTAALKFPAGAHRTTEEEEKFRQLQRDRLMAKAQLSRSFSHAEEPSSEEDAPKYRSAWNALRRQYSVFFEFYR